MNDVDNTNNDELEKVEFSEAAKTIGKPLILGATGFVLYMCFLVWALSNTSTLVSALDGFFYGIRPFFIYDFKYLNLVLALLMENIIVMLFSLMVTVNYLGKKNVKVWVRTFNFSLLTYLVLLMVYCINYLGIDSENLEVYQVAVTYLIWTPIGLATLLFLKYLMGALF